MDTEPRRLYPIPEARHKLGGIGRTTVYELINRRHVLGPVGSAVSVAQQGRMVPIGVASASATRRPVTDLYPGIAATRADLDLDAGLVDLNTVDGWTSQLYGLGVMGDLIDLNVDTMGLSLIGCPVRANGAASGELRGAVLGLFHRWRSVGGVDQIAELMIGPRADQPDGINSRPGDSGALWVWDETSEKTAKGGAMMLTVGQRSLPVISPLAMQWGGQVILDAAGGQPTDYVLASTLAGVAQTLGVSLLNDDSLTDHSLYWGKVGHYKIAASACQLGKPGTKLAKLLQANADRISVSDDDIKAGRLPSAAHRDQFIALADVPDLVWRSTRQKDAPSHFADMDEPGGPTVAHQTLLQLWDGPDPKWRTADGWTAFYDDLPQPPVAKHRGSLPFRVAQLYDVMVEAAKAKDVLTYVGAAGVLAHYVGDACQPLHVSRLHHGQPDLPEDDGVHGAYETAMLDAHAPEVVTGVNDDLGSYHVGSRGGPKQVHDSGEAAASVVALMKRTIEAIAPTEILNVYDANPGLGRTQALWDALGDRTIKRLADGARTLAVLWNSAWVQGGGEDIAASKTKALPTDSLKNLYDDRTFAPNVWLKDWDQIDQ